ncbi:(E)-4-hydroxy-3-methylbut-2-enyl-diphosphate synthase (flavodoxin) [hydrothermal vent metagenome]|uniref:(E)-4-hydroxy-3-methylbut-2-enyl-diphosphate synthase (Flavodoxin) n=1 Tax=hydrothermal vent metagenome TaxID=652676 RepID=A0A3B1CAW2_9ZZZZ
MVGKVKIGGGAPISIQSMTNTDTRDTGATIAQIIRLQEAGCELVRVAAPDQEAVEGLGEIKKGISIPLIADVHFDYRLALSSIDKGADCLRLNPGNIGAKWKVEEVTKAAQGRDVPIRIGVNAGSLKKDLLKKHGGPTAGAMAESAMEHIRILEDLNFTDLKVSLKASNVHTTVDAYRLLADSVDYPFHIGVSEAGTLWSGTIKSAVGVGILLNEGIGDTLRISLTADPVEEVKVAYEILKVLDIRRESPELVSCPTCGRCEIDLIEMANEVEQALATLKKPIKVAVMGCVVNGPGEAREADIGIAGGKGEGLIFRKGKILRKVPEAQLKDALLEEAMKL